MKNSFLLIILVFIWSCQSSDCTYDTSYLDQKNLNELSLKMIQDSEDCHKLRLSGEIFNRNKKYSIHQSISIHDSLYFIGNTPLFDFSQEKISGILQLNDSMHLEIDYFTDIPTADGKFRLFKSTPIERYYMIDLSYVFIANYRYGIVGEFIIGKENGEWFSTKHKGYIPNEKFVYSLFMKGDLL
ncbi:hypothetical protein [Faecalibacter rhinopitheci]|uniref:Uncharacterized protein n=1 Tax=Faecalibacter rhinopitheci TaxID=2779678 RepID=A0A8J7KB52_9FLAO|nr:hypothetical protein [Faecalibacter rhinopitheci]MBF0598240.1 hypothetical protein [Faecalibacter rhinopitheci]